MLPITKVSSSSSPQTSLVTNGVGSTESSSPMLRRDSALQSSPTATSATSSYKNLPSLPTTMKKERFEFKVFGHFTSCFENITAQCYHPSQQILVLGGGNGEIYFIGGDLQYTVKISSEHRIDGIQMDDQNTNMYLLCNHNSDNSSILIIYDFAKKQILQQINFQPGQNVQSIRYCKSYLLIAILDVSNPIMLVPYVKFMSTINFKFISPITLLHPMFNPNSVTTNQQQSQFINDLKITSVEPHPQYDHVVALGYSNGDW